VIRVKSRKNGLFRYGKAAIVGEKVVGGSCGEEMGWGWMVGIEAKCSERTKRGREQCNLQTHDEIERPDGTAAAVSVPF